MTFQPIDLRTWARREYFEHYFSAVPCQYSMTVKLDITGLRQRGLPLYPTMLYALARSVNRHEEFRTAFDGQGQLGIYDRLEPSYTVFHKDSQTFSCLWTEYQEDYAAFRRAYQADLDAYGSAEGFEGKPNTPPNVFNVSMIPWESFDSFHLHCPQGNSYLLPIFTIGRFYREGDRVLLPLAAQVHHAVCDGFHLCRLIGEVRAWLADGGPAAGGQPGREGGREMKKLALRALIKYLFGLVLVALLVFLPAGTLRFWNGRLLLAVLFLPMLPLGILLLVKAPELLEKRLHTREKEAAQRSVIALSGLMFLAGFLLAGLDYRFQWLPLPRWASLAAAVVFLAGYGLYGEVMRENAYLSRTVEVQEGQRVVDTGLYGVVRHPMYLATLLMFLSIPIVLGSLIALPVFLLYLPLVVRRIRNEEAVLENGLPGYREYTERVRYRLIPYIW